MHSKKSPPQETENLDQHFQADLQQQLEELQKQLQQAQEAEKRAMADYQNLVRRTQEERAHLIKLATKSLVGDLVQPLDHLSLAAQQIKDKGLDMVISQLWHVLEDHGLKEIRPLGEKFDLSTMEVVDKEADVTDEEAVVVKVVKTGYMLNGEVIQHAKVAMGKKNK